MKRFLLVKPPHEVTASYYCGGKEPCECIHFPMQTSPEYPVVLVTVDDWQRQQEAYQKLKDSDLILYETDDQDSAQCALQSYYEVDNGQRN